MSAKTFKLAAAALGMLIAFPASSAAQQEMERHYHKQVNAEQIEALRCVSQGFNDLVLAPAGFGHMGPSMAVLAPDHMEMFGPRPEIILRLETDLNLTAEQRDRIESLRDELTELRRSNIDEIEPIHERVLNALERDEPNLEEYENSLRELAKAHVDYAIETAKLSQKVLNTLGQEQRAKLRYGVHFIHELTKERCALSGDALGTR